MDNPTAPLVAIGVMLVALVFAVVGPGTPGASTPTRNWPTVVEEGRDHIAPDALATLMLEAPERLLLVDVRPPDEFARAHLPGAVNLDLVALLGPQGTEILDAAEGKTVVLVSNGMTHPAQAWVALTEAGRSDVFILEDGLDGFLRRTLTPPSLRGATTESRAKAEAPRFAALREHILATSPAAAGR